MRAKHVIKCEGDADRIVQGIVDCRCDMINSTFTLEVPSPDWVIMVQEWLVNECSIRDVPDTDNTYVDIIFDVRNSEADKMEQKLSEMTDEELNDFLSDLLDDLQDELDEEENNDD